MSEIDWSKAPEGATHYNPYNDVFYKVEDGDIYYGPPSRGWQVSACVVRDIFENPEVIPRPTKQEWEGGLPEVGCECEYRLGESVNWFPCRIKAVAKNQGAIIECDCEFGEQYVSFYGGQPVEFRPLRTKQQRQRDELALGIQNTAEQITDEAFPDSLANDLADAILSRYNLEPKP